MSVPASLTPAQRVERGRKGGLASATSLTPAQRSERARKAGLAASASLTPAQRAERAKNASRAADSLETHVRKVVDRAPELTAAQRERLAAIFAEDQVAGS